jgi:hypothetical protein
MEPQKRLLSKLYLVWRANPTESLVSLLRKLSGRERHAYIYHSYHAGVSDEIDTRVGEVDFSDWSDEAIEVALDAHLD